MARATWNGAVIAESDRFEIVEGNVYFPPETVKQEYLQPSDTHTVCWWKGTASYYTLAGMTTLGYMAAHSERARLGLMVGGIHYRQPALWIKATTALDVLSGGRAWFGIGAAWNEQESTALGFPMPPLRERFEWLEDTLRMAHAMWSGGSGTGERFEGTHLTATRLLNSPQALSRPRVPIMIGGGGERKTLRLVAQYAEGCNVFGGPERIAHKYAVLRGPCEPA